MKEISSNTTIADVCTNLSYIGKLVKKIGKSGVYAVVHECSGNRPQPAGIRTFWMMCSPQEIRGGRERIGIALVISHVNHNV